MGNCPKVLVCEVGVIEDFIGGTYYLLVYKIFIWISTSRQDK